MFNRRTFLASLIASATLDPERALWVTGKKIYSIPEPALYDPAIALPNMIPLAQEMARKFNKRAWDRLMWDMEFSKRGLPFPKMPEYRLPFHLIRGTGSAKDYMNPDL